MSKKLTIPELRELAKTTPLNKLAPLAGCSYQNLHRMFKMHGWEFLKVYQRKEKPVKEGVFDVDFYAKNTTTL